MELLSALRRGMEFVQSCVLTWDVGIFRGNETFSEKRGVGKIGSSAYLLGFVGGTSLGFVLAALFFGGGAYREMTVLYVWAVYLLMISFFHFHEFFVVAVCQPKNVSYECKWAILKVKVITVIIIELI